jgi:hypothetical protein
VQNTKLTAALQLAKQGHKVFPLVPDGKTPLLSGSWREHACDNPEQIKQWWGANPNANIGITMEKLVALDIDPRNGGDPSYELLRMLYDMPHTRRHVTWSQGSHILYRQPEGVQIGCPKNHGLGAGIDVKGLGGYLVAPGSTIKGKPYWVANPDREIAELPQDLVALCGQAIPKSESAGKRLVEEDDIAITLADHWLQLNAPEAVEGQRNNTAYQVAAKLYDFGVSRDTCREMLSDWSYAKCFPPMDQEDIDLVARSAATNRAKAIGCSHPLAPGFEPGDEEIRIKEGGSSESGASKIEIKGRLIKPSSEFISNFTPPEYLLDGVIQRRFLYALTARTGAGKTAIALWLAQAVALARALGTRQIRKGRVVYLAGENADDVRMRWIAMAEHLKFDPHTIDVHFIDHKNRKLSEIGPRIFQEVTELGGAELVTIDTSQAYFEGDDENNNAQALAHAQRMRELTGLLSGPSVLALCHPIKNASDDRLIPRGGGSFVAEMDGNLICTKDDPLTTLHWHEKFRGADFAPIPFEICRVTSKALVDAAGRSLTTAIGKPISDSEMGAIEGNRHGEEDRVLAALRDFPRVSLASIATVLGWSKDGKPEKWKVQRVCERLIKDKLLTKERGKNILTEKGEKVAKPLPATVVETVETPQKAEKPAATTADDLWP